MSTKRHRVTVRWSREYQLWAVDGGGAFCRLKREAVEQGRIAARNAAPSQLIVKGKDGRIQEERTYGADPERHKG